ncbi:MAG: DnaJ domain-containing protein [Clostridium sp.]|nr:DnaJ domain-containing protein [Clostridium sp.]
MNPYKILGIPPTASKDEIENAYERIVDTYHVDNTDSDDYYLMEDKISEANEAYNTLINDLKYKEIRNLIESEQFISAETELNLISDKNNAEWNYLKGFIMLKKGWVQSGVNHLKTAAELNPTNPEYKETMAILSRKINAIKQNYVRAATAANMNANQNNMNMCGGNNAGNNGMCGDMGNLANMMGGSNPLANPIANNPASASTPNGGMPQNPANNVMNGNPIQNMLLQNLFSSGNNGAMNMCGNSGGKMC